MSISPAILKANTIIRSLHIKNPSDIDINSIAMHRGAYVQERRIDGAEAWLVRKRNLAIITVNSNLGEQGRRRFAIAHELGHFELHSDSQLLICRDEDMYVWNQSRLQEIEANEFASCILMPAEIFSRYIKQEAPNMNSVSLISNEFGTSLTATAIRYVQLSSEPCAVAISTNCVLKWYKKSSNFNFHLKVGDKLSPDTYAFDYFDGKDLSERPRKVPANAWVAGDINTDSDIVEHSIALKSYGIVLSLLWIDKEIFYSSQKFHNEDQEFDLTNKFTPDGKRWQW